MAERPADGADVFLWREYADALEEQAEALREAVEKALAVADEYIEQSDADDDCGVHVGLAAHSRAKATAASNVVYGLRAALRKAQESEGPDAEYVRRTGLPPRPRRPIRDVPDTGRQK